MKKIIYSVLIIISVLSVWIAAELWLTFFQSNTREGTSYIYIKKGTNLKRLAEEIEATGKIINLKRFLKVADYYDLENDIKSGRYKISKGMDNRLLVRTFKFGWQTPHNLTLSGNIRSMEKLASIISGKTESDSITVLQALTNQSFIDSLGFTMETFPSLFLLNTYEIFWTTSPKNLIIRFKNEFENFWDTTRTNKAKALGLTPIQVTTLASIVAEESNIKTEHPVIAGVYINRLKRGIPLQADPTVKFAINDPSVKRILYKHLKIESPYNTYIIKGLPPGPITLPSPEVIDSVLNYSKHNYLYFCAKPTLDGSHLFAATLSEHNKNARAYQKAISRLK